MTSKRIDYRALNPKEVKHVWQRLLIYSIFLGGLIGSLLHVVPVAAQQREPTNSPTPKVVNNLPENSIPQNSNFFDINCSDKNAMLGGIATDQQQGFPSNQATRQGIASVSALDIEACISILMHGTAYTELYFQNSAPRMSLFPKTATLEVKSGERFYHRLQLFNESYRVATYKISISNNSWSTTVPERVGPLQPGELTYIDILINAPEDAAIGVSDEIKLTFLAFPDTEQTRGYRPITATIAAAVNSLDTIDAAPATAEPVTIDATVATFDIAHNYSVRESNSSGELITRYR